jgi:hypothetical protein
MPSVVTTDDKIECGHGGTIQTASDARLTVAKANVLTRAGVEGRSLPAPPAPGSCKTPVVTTAPASAPCTKCTSLASGSEAKRLTVGGVSVLFHPLSGQTDGNVSGTTPQVLLKSVVGQTKLTAV